MIRAYVSDHHYGMGVSIAIVNHLGEGESLPAMVKRFGEDGLETWDQLEPLAQIRPTLTLTDDEARSLLDSLTRHYHGAEDTRALRRDYDAERERVDKLISMLGMLAQSCADAE